MKKILSTLLAIAISASISVAYAGASISGSRNNKNNQVAYVNSDDMPGFRVGDEITFNLSNLTVGNVVTVCSSKCNGSANMSTDSSDFVYINEYTLDSATKSFAYTVSEADTGIYCIIINDGEGTVATFYYKLGNIELKMGTRSGLVTGSATGYNIQATGDGTYQVGFIGTAKFDMRETNLADFAYNLGFNISNGTSNKKVQFTNAQLASLQTFFDNQKYEIDNGANTVFVYGTTVYKVPSGMQNSLSATAIVE